MDLSNSDLSDTIFTICNFANSNLTQANLRNTKFINCDLSNANLTSIITEYRHIYTGHTGHVVSVSISSDNSIIVSGSGDKTVRLWDARTQECIKVLEGHTNEVSSVSISNDQQYIISGSDDNTIRLWSTKSQQGIKVLNGHASYAYSVIFSSNSKYIISGSRDKTIRVWNIESGQQICELNNFDYAGSLSLSRDSSWLVSSTGESGNGSLTSNYWVRRWNIGRLLNVSGEQQQNLMKDWTRVYADYGLEFKNCAVSNIQISVEDRTRYIK